MSPQKLVEAVDKQVTTNIKVLLQLFSCEGNTYYVDEGKTKVFQIKRMHKRAEHAILFYLYYSG